MDTITELSLELGRVAKKIELFKTILHRDYVAEIMVSAQDSNPEFDGVDNFAATINHIKCEISHALMGPQSFAKFKLASTNFLHELIKVLEVREMEIKQELIKTLTPK